MGVGGSYGWRWASVPIPSHDPGRYAIGFGDSDGRGDCGIPAAMFAAMRPITIRHDSRRCGNGGIYNVCNVIIYTGMPYAPPDSSITEFASARRATHGSKRVWCHSYCRIAARPYSERIPVRYARQYECRGVCRRGVSPDRNVLRVTFRVKTPHRDASRRGKTPRKLALTAGILTEFGNRTGETGWHDGCNTRRITTPNRKDPP